MSDGQKAAVQRERNNMRVSGNRGFMRESLEKVAYCPVTGGSGITATYQQGVTLVFDMPVIGSAYAKELLITYNLSVTPGAGTNAVYQPNAGAPWNIFQELILNYNGPQVRTHPYVFKLLDQLLGFGRLAQNAVAVGNDPVVAAQIVGSTGVTTGVANTWQGKMRLPLNALGWDSVPGILPIMGVGNKPQLKLTCASAFLGVDPLLNPISLVSGSNGSVTVTGTVNVDVVYLDGINMSDRKALDISLKGEPTLQYLWDTALNPLNANLLQRQHIAALLEHWYVLSIIIDGNQSNKFAALSNIYGFELSPDSIGQAVFQRFSPVSNVSIYDWYDRIRRMIGQDLDEGVIPWVSAPTRGIVDADNRNGHQVLNMRSGGFPAATHGYQMNSVGGVTGITPRVETFLISMNYDGLRIDG